MTFKNCLHCELFLSGKQRKFCSEECGDNYRAEKTREANTEKQLKQMEIDMIPMNYLRLNSSEAAFNEAKQLLK